MNIWCYVSMFIAVSGTEEACHIDFDANLWEIVYEGVYNGVKIHWTDYDRAINRALAHGVEKIIIQADELKPCRRALEIAREFNSEPRRVYSTTGLQPSLRHQHIDLIGAKERYRPYLENILIKNRRYVICVGKTGLRFTKDELLECSKEKQMEYLYMQLELAEEYQLPIVLYCRNSTLETLECLSAFRDKVTAVISSFSGSIVEADAYMDLGAYIGISGCSLKRNKNLKVVHSLPSERILFGSNCPYCKLKKTYPSYKYVKSKFRVENRKFWSPSSLVKGRTEPINVIQLVEAVAGIRAVKTEQMLEESRNNFYNVFLPEKLTEISAYAGPSLEPTPSASSADSDLAQ